MMQRRTVFGLIQWCLAIAAMLAMAAQAAAQDAYPNKPIRMVVASAPGGPLDGLARLFSQGLAERLGPNTAVVVDNKPGANFQIAEGIVARAAPDGYTFGVSAIGHAINPSLYSKMAYDPLKDLTGLFMMAQVEVLLVANANVPPSTVKELVAWSKGNEDQMTFGSGGTGSGGHLIAEMFGQAAGIPIRHVPYKSVPNIVQDLVGGRISFAVGTVHEMAPLIRAGKLKAIATSSPARVAALPDVPTFAESGYPTVKVTSWFAMFAPTGTPAAIINKVWSELTVVSQGAEVRSALAQYGMLPFPMTPAQLNGFVQSEASRWNTVVRKANIRLD